MEAFSTTTVDIGSGLNLNHLSISFSNKQLPPGTVFSTASLRSRFLFLLYKISYKLGEVRVFTSVSAYVRTKSPPGSESMINSPHGGKLCLFISFFFFLCYQKICDNPKLDLIKITKKKKKRFVLKIKKKKKKQNNNNYRIIIMQKETLCTLRRVVLVAVILVNLMNLMLSLINHTNTNSLILFVVIISAAMALLAGAVMFFGSTFLKDTGRYKTLILMGIFILGTILDIIFTELAMKDDNVAIKNTMRISNSALCIFLVIFTILFSRSVYSVRQWDKKRKEEVEKVDTMSNDELNDLLAKKPTGSAADRELLKDQQKRAREVSEHRKENLKAQTGLTKAQKDLKAVQK